jgi:hypothetical protein
MTDAIAEALVLAVQYIADRPPDADISCDVKQLESAASCILQATQEEKDALVRAAIRLGLKNWPREVGIEE